VETIFYFMFTLLGLITGWILRGHMDRRTDDQHGDIHLSCVGDGEEPSRTGDRLEKTIEGAERTNHEAAQTIEKMQELLHSVRRNNDHTGSDNLPSS
jgi:hypothetical protein